MKYIKSILIIIVVSFIGLDVFKTFRATCYYPMERLTIFHPENPAIRLKIELTKKPGDERTLRKANRHIKRLKKAISWQPYFADYYYDLVRLEHAVKSDKAASETPEELIKIAINLNPTSAKYHFEHYRQSKKNYSLYVGSQLSPLHLKSLWLK